jgi:uncharacterized membrane protein
MSTNEPPPEQPPPAGYGEAPPPPPPAAPPGGSGGYSVGNAFTYGWNKFTQNLGQILVAVLVLVGVLVVVQLVGFFIGRAVACDPSFNLTTGETETCNGGLFTAQNIVSWAFSLISWIISMIIGAGIVRAALDITAGRQLEPSTMLRPHKLGDVVIASLLIGILTFVGFILCVIPGILVAFFTSYTLYFLMDREELGAIDAIKASFDFTKNNAANVILWFLLSVVAWFVGALLCGIGLVVAVPVVLIGTAYTYKTLNNQPVAA